MAETARADPLTAKGEEIKSALQKEYGEEKGERILYAGENKGTFTGIHDAMKACADAVEGLNRRVDAYCARRADEFAEQPAQDIREDDLSRTMYKGYAIVLNHDDKMFYISKGGAHVGTASSMSAAKEMVDMDAKGTFKNDDRRVIGGTEIEITGVSDK